MPGSPVFRVIFDSFAVQIGDRFAAVRVPVRRRRHAMRD
jgi:hypothetical protein